MHQLSKATNPHHGPTPRRCARGLVEGLPQIMWFIRGHMRRHRTRGLSVPQFRTLALLERYPAVGVSAIADHLGCTLPTASRMATGLVAKGLVTRCECAEDRRQVVLGLTPRGRETLLKSRAATIDCVAEKIGGLDEKQQRAVIEAMRLLRPIFDAPAPGTPGSTEDHAPNMTKPPATSVTPAAPSTRHPRNRSRS